MKRFRKISLVLIVVAILFACSAFAFACNNKDTNADKNHITATNQYKANMHTHTTASDGDLKPNVVISNYENAGYDILAITDHVVTTYPWDKYDATSTMTSVKGTEAECVVAHINCYFYDGALTGMGSVDSVLNACAEQNGIAVLNHPGRYEDKVSVEQWASWYTAHPNLVAMEIVNRNNRYKNDRVIYDAVLTKLMPQRIVYCVAADDYHKTGHGFYSYTVFTIPDKEPQTIKTALSTGAYYCVSTATVENATGDAPVILDVKVENGEAVISGENYHTVKWISCGDLVDSDNSVSLSQCEKYVRCELIGNGGIAYSQPIAIWEE